MFLSLFLLKRSYVRSYLQIIQMLAKFAEDDRIEQMNAQKRRMKQLEHKRAVEALIEDRRKQFEAEKVNYHNSIIFSLVVLIFLVLLDF